MGPAIYPPVIKEREVTLNCERAFDLFTRDMESWWPFESHSVFEDRKVAFRFECREGGRLVETGPDGKEAVWGTVTRFDRPHAVGFTWHPGRDPVNEQSIEVTFEPLESGTRVRLVHSGWERLGDQAERIRSGYDTGWDLVFVERYGSAAAVPSS